MTLIVMGTYFLWCKYCRGYTYQENGRCRECRKLV